MRLRAIFIRLTVAFVALASLAACGDDDGDTIALADWVAEFDRICVDVIGRLGPDTTEEQFREVSEAALADMRSLGEPDEQADAAAAMLESIERSTLEDDITQEEVDALDDQFLEAAQAVGVSDECIGGPQG
jgi:hypothetical protein